MTPARYTDRYSGSVERLGTPARLTDPTDERTDGLTQTPTHQPEITASSVTHGRAYGFLPRRFTEKVDFQDCWIWTAAKDTPGYGVFSLGRRNVKAHRYAYELLVGPIPAGLECDHLCRVRACVNPDHIELVTHRENIARAEIPSFTAQHDYDAGQCRNAHDLATFGVMHRDGYMRCRECARVRDAARRTFLRQEKP